MLSDINFKLIYSSGEDEPIEFFMDSLMESTSFDLGLGYFSTSAFRTLSLGFAYFISRGGKMRIIINDVLSPEDKAAILKGQNTIPDELIESKLIQDLSSFYETLSKKDKHFFNCISWLIATKKVEIKAIVPNNNEVGIAHQKFGIFKDDNNNTIAFTGSANFSSNALQNNIETISCYKSWIGEKSETSRINLFQNLFQKNWSGKNENVRLIPLENVKVFIRNNFPVNSLEELLVEEKDILDEVQPDILEESTLKYKVSELQSKLLPIQNEPHFPNNSEPRDYQNQALNNWRNSNCQGFFEMATGTGKTITSLNCILSLYRSEGKYRFLVLVPTLSLATQWAEEAHLFNFQNIIISNSKNSNWVEECLLQINKSYLLNSSFGIITTYATFALPKFQSIVNSLTSDTLIIADEAHNFGTERLINLYPHKFLKRIGLSATPERHFDNQGTRELLQYFNAVAKPTFKFDMEEAIEKGFLCEYYYYPKIVKLTKEELEEYKKISKRLLKYFDASTGHFQRDNPTVTSLLLKRKRIIHKAEKKKDCLRDCISEIKSNKGVVNYTLVYVPEGSDSIIDDFDEKLINEYSRIISEEFDLSQHQFIGGTENKEDVLARFSEGKVAVLTAMKCLDEGVDVRRTETAVFCSSTGNPRQFIQRRGRILRTHDEKRNAYIYDMIVVPDIKSWHDSSLFWMEKSILKSELKRVYEFSTLSKNKYQSLKTLEDVADEFNIDIFSSSIA